MIGGVLVAEGLQQVPFAGAVHASSRAVAFAAATAITHLVHASAGVG